MDSSRLQDLELLYERFNDPTKPKWARTRAYRAFQQLQRQFHDRHLLNLRLRLVRAVRANDKDIVAKIEEQLRVYSFRQGYSDKAA